MFDIYCLYVGTVNETATMDSDISLGLICMHVYQDVYKCLHSRDDVLAVRTHVTLAQT